MKGSVIMSDNVPIEDNTFGALINSRPPAALAT